MEENHIIEACCKHNQLAQQWVFNKYADKMYFTCLRYTSNERDAEDVMITAFARVFKYIRKYRKIKEGSFEGWIKKIMINESLRFLSKKKKIFWLEETVIEDEIYEADLGGLDNHEIYNCIKALPEGYRTVFNLYAIDELNHKEIAEKLGISENTSKSQLHKARKMLISLLSKNESYEQRII